MARGKEPLQACLGLIPVSAINGLLNWKDDNLEMGYRFTSSSPFIILARVAVFSSDG